MKFYFIILVSLFFLANCSPIKSNTQKANKNFGIDVIYGQDDRLDFYQILSVEWARIADSSVAIIDRKNLELSEDKQSYQIDAHEYGKLYNLCPDEKYYEQPSASFCSGFLISPEIVVTAGHCIRNEYGCENARFVFGYSIDSELKDPTQIKAEDVFECKEVIHSVSNGLNGLDLALIRLERKVLNHSPMMVRTQGKIQNTAPLTVIGYPSGLPGKIADRGIIRKNLDDIFFVTTLDTYGGNSGSAVINSQSKVVEGILVRGATDFIVDPQSQCRRSNFCQTDSCRGEDVVRIEHIFEHLNQQDLNSLQYKL